MFQIFVPDPPQNSSPEKKPIERRKHPRYRYFKEVAICPASGIEFSATIFEISESGMSAASPNYLNVGDLVEMFPVADSWVKAIVRRKVGAMYGFEFLHLTLLQKRKLKQLCADLPPFKSMTEI
jgi:c-di-GMP-binding flagellar brake protein YcgR